MERDEELIFTVFEAHGEWLFLRNCRSKILCTYVHTRSPGIDREKERNRAGSLCIYIKVKTC